jgi:hypothetical protein
MNDVYALVYSRGGVSYRKDSRDVKGLKLFITKLIIETGETIGWKILNPGGIAIAGNGDW